MNIRQLLLLSLSICFSITAIKAQNPDKISKAVQDSLFRVWRLEYEQEALQRQAEFLFWLDTTKITNLFQLDMSKMMLKKMPDLNRFRNLKQVDFSGNELKVVAAVDFMTDSLKTIHLENNQLRKVHFPSSESVVMVSLHDNKLKKIPRSIRKLKNLRFLDLEKNQIRRIPRFIKDLDSLKEINLNYNKVRLSKSSIRRLARLEQLSIGANKIINLPSNMGEMQHLRTLIIGKNKLSELPPSFAGLKTLEHVNFYENNFTEFPAEILLLPRLVEIDFYYNQLSSLPDGLGNLSNLTHLFLSFNKLTVLPDTLRNLKKLSNLYAHNNRLTTLPAWIGQLSELQRIGLGYNQITDLPDLTNLPLLTDLDVQSNLIRRFPWELLDKKGIQLLMLKNNRIRMNNQELEKLKRRKEELMMQGFVLIY
jgi:Leucine-rich repeat (LRR) protein